MGHEEAWEAIHRRRSRRRPPDEAAICADLLDGMIRDDVARRHHIDYRTLKAILARHGLADYRVRPRRDAQPEDPVRCLALAVIAAACEDWRQQAYPARFQHDVLRGMPKIYHDPPRELECFFRSLEYRWWCDLAELDAQAVLEAIGARAPLFAERVDIATEDRV